MAFRGDTRDTTPFAAFVITSNTSTARTALLAGPLRPPARIGDIYKLQRGELKAFLETTLVDVKAEEAAHQAE
jgi:hypothetical protein